MRGASARSGVADDQGFFFPSPLVQDAALRDHLRRQHRLDHARDVVASSSRAHLPRRSRSSPSSPPPAPRRSPARSAAASRSAGSGSTPRRPPGSPGSPSGCSRRWRRRRGGCGSPRRRPRPRPRVARVPRRPGPARSAWRRARPCAAGRAASCRFASACAMSAAFDALVCSSSRCLSEIARSASSCASLARRAWMRRHDLGVGLRLGRRLAAPRLGHLRLHDLDVERVEDQPEVGELARARLPDDHRERIVLVLDAGSLACATTGAAAVRARAACQCRRAAASATPTASSWPRRAGRASAG